MLAGIKLPEFLSPVTLKPASGVESKPAAPSAGISQQIQGLMQGMFIGSRGLHSVRDQAGKIID